MLTIKAINVYYGKLHVLWDLSLEVGKESVGLLGPNGAGKTTLINAIVGLAKPADGDIAFDGKSLLRLQTHRIIREGIAVVPQERELFPRISIRGNLEAGAAYVPGARDRVVERMEFVFNLFPFLKKRFNQPAGTLSGGEQRMLAIGRALMADPKFLILDEPSSGLQPSLVTELYSKLRELKGEVSMLLAEQNVRQSLKAVDRGYIIENGRITLEGDAQSLAHDDHVRKSYLGL
jgi:branched-chain amino acid transport system ATP-binding protein